MADSSPLSHQGSQVVMGPGIKQNSDVTGSEVRLLQTGSLCWDLMSKKESTMARFGEEFSRLRKQPVKSPCGRNKSGTFLS